jgi:ABC-type nickel/cobalt efflux system permease component RcnA
VKPLLAAMILVLALGALTPAAAGNPFVSGKPSAEKSETVQADEGGSSGLISSIYAWAARAQRELKRRLTSLAGEMRQDPWGPACLTFLGLCFLYGVVHALGPGHGKSVVCAYFLARPGTLRSGLAMGCAIPFIHVGSAVTVVLLGVKLFSLAGMEFLDASEDWLLSAGYAFLLVIGAVLAVRAVVEMRGGGPPCREEAKTAAGKHMAVVSLAAGIAPCPGAAIVLVFAMSLGLLPQGLAAMIFLAAGMAATTTSFAVAAVASRQAALRLSENHGRLFNYVYGGLAMTGALIVAGFGGVMLLGRFGG